jgi:hypothetical protein
MRSHYELDLIKPYYKLAADFKTDMQQKLSLAMAHGYSFTTGLSPNDLIRFITEKKIILPRSMYKNNFRLIRSLMAGLIRYKSGDLYGVYDIHNELASVAMFAWINNQINLIFQVVATDQLNTFAHFFLIDRFVAKYSETNTTLVFDSAIKSLTPLNYAAFGARETNHVEIIHNGLPFPLNFIYSLLYL